MAGLFNKWFASKARSERQLDHPSQLTTGDLVKFKLLAPPLLAGQTFKVDEVNTYHYEHSVETEFVLRGSPRRTLFMTVDINEDDPALRLSVKLSRAEVASLFDLDQFARIFDQEEGEVIIHRQHAPDEPGHLLADLQGFTAPEYVRTAFAITAYFCKGDFRERREALDEADGESLDYYCVTSADERHAIECEVYDGDDDVMCTLIEDTRLIDELWPAS